MVNNQLLTDKGFKLEKYPDGEFYVLRTGDDELVSKIFDVCGIEYTLYEDESMPNILIQTNAEMTSIQYLINDSGEVGDITNDEFIKLMNLL